MNFTIFSKFGGGGTTLIIGPFERKMSAILTQLTDKTKDENIHIDIQFHIEFSVDGEFFQYGDPDGCSNLRFFKKKNVVAITIALSNDLIESHKDIDNYMKEMFRLAIEKMLDRILKEKIAVNKNGVLLKLDSEIGKYW